MLSNIATDVPFLQTCYESLDTIRPPAREDPVTQKKLTGLFTEFSFEL